MLHARSWSGWATGIGVLIMALLVVFSLVRVGQKLAGDASAAVSSAVAATEGVAALVGTDGVQRVTLGFRQFNYVPDVIRVRRGIPVALTADASLVGCFTTFVIPKLNVWKQFTATDRTLAFMPNRSGTFRFTCAMGMGRGTLIVEG